MVRVIQIAILAATLFAAPAIDGQAAEPLSALLPQVVVDFDSDVMPIFTKAGCNAGACHGAAIGRGDFRLSLFGANPQSDYDQIVRHRLGRRVDRLAPEQSLVLLKPTEALDHEGGTRIDLESESWNLLVQWITQGAKRQLIRKLESIRIEPASSLESNVNQSHPLIVSAHFSDGSKRDVTALTIFEPLDPQSISVNEGLLTPLRTGRHYVLVRYQSLVQLVSITASQGPPLDLAREPRYNWIDDEIYRQLSQIRVAPARLAVDSALVRRVTLDLTGRIPRPEIVQAFEESTAADKYERLVQQLIDSDDFVSFWTHHVSDWLRVGTGKMTSDAANSYHAWIENAIRHDGSIATMAKNAILSHGPISDGATGFYRVTDDARLQAELTSEIWMGVRLRCANCHDHPLDHWTQDDYHGLSAIFARMNHGPIVGLKSSGTVQHPRSGQPAIPKLPGDNFINADDPRAAYAEWLTNPKNPYFSKNVVNRVWQLVMGRGLYDPIDDQRITNPVSNPELLAKLADDFVVNDYRLRPLIHSIVTSAAYRRGAQQSELSLQMFFGSSLTRNLLPEVLLDAVNDVLELDSGIRDVGQVNSSNAGMELRIASSSGVDLKRVGEKIAKTIRNIQLAVPFKNEELKSLGVCDRSPGCTTNDFTPSDSLARVLQWLNGPILNQRIADPKNWLNQAMDSGLTDHDVLFQLFRRAYSRTPSEIEFAYWESIFYAAPKSESDANHVVKREIEQRRKLWHDVCWSILSSHEFRTNH